MMMVVVNVVTMMVTKEQVEGWWEGKRGKVGGSQRNRRERVGGK